MRMKKIMIFAVAALTLAACSKTFDHNKSEGAAIGFGTWAETLTKRTQGASEFVANDTFVVEGYKTIGGSPSEVFDNVTVTASGSPITWDYTNHRFWDINATSYSFFAVSSPTTALAFEDDGTITATEIDFAGNNNDILVANQVNVAKGDSPYFNNYATVPFVFKHIGALVDLKIAKTSSLNDATVAIEKVSLIAIAKTAKVAITGYTTLVPTIAWTDHSYDNYTDVNTLGVSTKTLPTNVSSSTPDDLIDDLIVMPQTLTDTKLLRITYKITDGANNENTYTDVDIKLNKFDKTNDTDNTTPFITAWEAGKHYTYTLTIGANIINFSGTITDWTAEDAGYHYLLN